MPRWQSRRHPWAVPSGAAVCLTPSASAAVPTSLGEVAMPPTAQRQPCMANSPAFAQLGVNTGQPHNSLQHSVEDNSQEKTSTITATIWRSERRQRNIAGALPERRALTRHFAPVPLLTDQPGLINEEGPARVTSGQWQGENAIALRRDCKPNAVRFSHPSQEARAQSSLKHRCNFVDQAVVRSLRPNLLFYQHQLMQVSDRDNVRWHRVAAPLAPDCPQHCQCQQTLTASFPQPCCHMSASIRSVFGSRKRLI